MADLTDKEITEACARAAMCVPISAPPHVKLDGGSYVMHISKRRFVYNPLTDRAQAMELVEKIGMSVEQRAELDWVARGWYEGSSGYIARVDSVDTNLLRAICLCAARVQIEKEKNANG